MITDTLSCLIDIDPDIILEPELKDYEFGSYCFETLPKARSSSVSEKLASVDGVDVCEISITHDNGENSPNSVEMPLSDQKFSQLQIRDEKIHNLRVRVSNGEYPDFYKMENNVLYHMVIKNNHKFDAAVLPAELVNTALFLGHNQSGHNSFQRTYAAIKRIYYWKGMHKDILRYCKGCLQCAKHRVEKRKFIEQSFKPGIQPVEYIISWPMPKETKQEFEKLKEDYPEVFSLNNQDIGHTQSVTMHVDTRDSPPICQKPYTLPLKHYSWVQQEIETLEQAGIIKKSLSPWASPIVVVPKKSRPGEPPRQRMCVDFRKINDLQPQVRRVDSATSGNISLVPLPKIDEMYAMLHGANIFTTLDLRSGYYHINLDEESKAKTAFVTPFGKYEFNSVLFGLAQAPAYFQQLISMVLQDCRDFAMAYLDDIIIFSRTPEEHLKHIEIIFQKLKAAGLKLKESKCDFFKSEIHYLGHLISDKGIQPLPEKRDTI